MSCKITPVILFIVTALFSPLWADPGHDDRSVRASLGKARIGAWDVEAIQIGKVEAGKEATFEFLLKGEGEPQALRVWVGIESGRGSVKGKGHKHDADFEVHVEVPDPIPAGARVWVELETPDGKFKSTFEYKQN